MRAYKGFILRVANRRLLFSTVGIQLKENSADKYENNEKQSEESNNTCLFTEALLCQAPSTRIRIFLKTLFSCCRVDGRKWSFSKMLKSQHRFTLYKSIHKDLWGSCEGIWLVCFPLSKFEDRSLTEEASS